MWAGYDPTVPMPSGSLLVNLGMIQIRFGLEQKQNGSCYLKSLVENLVALEKSVGSAVDLRGLKRLDRPAHFQGEMFVADPRAWSSR